METKKCFKCGESKELAHFYKHKGMADGHLGKCKLCTMSDTDKKQKELRKNPDWVEKEKKRQREKYLRLGHKKPTKEYLKKSYDLRKAKYPEKYLAKNKSQRLPKTLKSNHLHHWSYNKEHYTDCIELSPLEHYKLHRYIIYDQERMMYRRCDNLELLDTKEKHLEFYDSLLNKP